MIKLSGFIHFTFDQEGIAHFTMLLEKLQTEGSASFAGIPYIQKDGSQQIITLMLSAGPDSTLKTSRTLVRLTLDPEDIENSLERFKEAQTTPEKAFYPSEWIYVKLLSTRKSTYLYIHYTAEFQHDDQI